MDICYLFSKDTYFILKSVKHGIMIVKSVKHGIAMQVFALLLSFAIYFLVSFVVIKFFT